MDRTPGSGPSSLPGEFAAMLRQAPPRRLLTILALMTGSALSDGFGIAMLVPMLQFAGAGRGSPAMAGAFERLGLPIGLNLLLALFVGLVTIRAALVYWVSSYRNRLNQELTDGLRRRCYEALVRAEWRWLSQQRSADHSAALVSNSAQAGVGLDQALGLTFSALTSAVLLTVSMVLAWQVTLFAIVAGGILLAVIRRRFSRSLELGRATNAANRGLHRQVEQGLGQLRETKILGSETTDLGRFAGIIGGIRARKQAHRDGTALGTAAIQIGAAALLAATVYLGLNLFHTPLPRLLPLLLVLLRMAPLVQSFQLNWSQWLYSLPAHRELAALIAQAEAHAEPPAAPGAPPRLEREIAFDAVSVRLGERQALALDTVSFTIPARATAAIVGPSGAGKSTVADVLSGLIAPDRGALKIDGQTLAAGDRRRWREAVAYVQQSPFLHPGSVRDNLLWAVPDADEAALQAALKSACAEFVLALPQGLDTEIGDAGWLLSGGERQRIAIARTLLRKPQVLILDEATSALDNDCEAAVLAAVAQLRGQLTIVLIGHRLAMLEQADLVIELQAGRVVETGTASTPL